MKIKSLITKMSRKKIESVCEEKGWRLPTFEEGQKYIDEIEYDMFWVEGEEFSPYTDDEGEMRPLVYNKGTKHTLNSSFMTHVVVIKEDRVCPSCGESCRTKK